MTTLTPARIREILRPMPTRTAALARICTVCNRPIGMKQRFRESGKVAAHEECLGSENE